MPHDTFVDVSKEYEKNDNLKKEDIQFLQEWVDGQPHLPEISELYLILFLHRCYYKIEAAKDCIETFYTARARLPELFRNRSDSVKTKFLDTVLYAPLSKLTPEGNQILFCKLMDINLDNFMLEEHLKHLDMVTILMLHQTGTVPGHIILSDLSGLTVEHIAQLRPLLMKKLFYYMQEAMPNRLIHFIFINVPPYMSGFWTLAKTFLKSEFLNKLQLYSDNFNEVYQFIPKECFPSDYGGEAESIDELTRKIKENLLANQRFFSEDEKKIANESKRVSKLRSLDCIFEEETLFSSTYGI